MSPSGKRRSTVEAPASPVVLMDSNALIALAVGDHVHHTRTRTLWWQDLGASFATCPITQGALLRFAIQRGTSAGMALELLRDHTSADSHTFWPDSVGFDSVSLAGVIGHRQVTDAYLAALARSRRGSLATLDEGLAELHADVALLIPS